jgi:hypothetical protein
MSPHGMSEPAIILMGVIILAAQFALIAPVIMQPDRKDP